MTTESESTGTTIAPPEHNLSTQKAGGGGASPGAHDGQGPGPENQQRGQNPPQGQGDQQQGQGGNASWWQKLKQSFLGAFGEVVFGMEDGTVSIFGLVFGVAATAPNALTVLSAGAAGAAAAAVSMSAGAWLDTEIDAQPRPGGDGAREAGNPD